MIVPKGVEKPFIDNQWGEFRIVATSSANAYRLEIISSVFWWLPRKCPLACAVRLEEPAA